MIAGLKPYPVMKDSGVPWLGEVPEHWKLQRGKNFLRCIDIRSETGEEELLTVSSERGVVPRRTASVTMFKAESYAGHKLCWSGDLVINSLWAWARGLGVSRHHGIVSTAYGVYRPRRETDIEPQFLHQLVRSTPFHWELQVRSKGVWTSRLQLTDESFLDAPFPLPPLPEQTAIVRFLDHADRRIRRYIRAKQKLIKLLEEQKQAIIHRAVTRGLNPNVRLKPSGVEWLGDVPGHWDVKPLKYVVPQVTVGIVIQPARLYVNKGVPCLRSLNISGGVIKPESLVFISPESNLQQRKSQIFVGDIVVVRTGQAGVAAIVTPEFDGANCIDLLIVRRSPKLLSDYLLVFLNSWAARTDVRYRSVGAIQAHYNTATLANLVVPVPPLYEQHKLLDNLAGQLSPISDSTKTAEREIALLGEYRTRLIADVVTGKLDVREAAARLPDEVEELEPLEDTNALIGGEEEPTDDLDVVSEEAEA
jgi:type I restriction enzyme, S subunit